MSQEAFTQLCHTVCDGMRHPAAERDYWQSIYLAACRHLDEEPDMVPDLRLSRRQNSRRALYEILERHGEGGRELLTTAEREIAAALRRRVSGRAGDGDERAAS